MRVILILREIINTLMSAIMNQIRVVLTLLWVKMISVTWNYEEIIQKLDPKGVVLISKMEKYTPLKSVFI